ncbi:three-helix bundle dimerization domain-containing protein [Streptomyces showdoensis]|uniref:three-helix bundle dimerization domain-containing protein n=1 Tax=Streptomyces showdoensis TaxID=68268 RepID=UPI0013F4BED4|nr:hypothetical protein [Streptomyces showdoensis]
MGRGNGVAMTVEERAPYVGEDGSGDGPGGPCAPDAVADAAPGSSDEEFTLDGLVARLAAAYPSVDAAAVEVAVRRAYGHFERARIRAYLPILVERRSRKALDVVRASGSGPAPDGGPRGPEPAAEPGPATDRRQDDDGTVGFRGKAAPGLGG